MYLFRSPRRHPLLLLLGLWMMLANVSASASTLVRLSCTEALSDSRRFTHKMTLQRGHRFNPPLRNDEGIEVPKKASDERSIAIFSQEMLRLLHENPEQVRKNVLSFQKILSPYLFSDLVLPRNTALVRTWGETWRDYEIRTSSKFSIWHGTLVENAENIAKVGVIFSNGYGGVYHGFYGAHGRDRMNSFLGGENNTYAALEVSIHQDARTVDFSSAIMKRIMEWIQGKNTNDPGGDKVFSLWFKKTYPRADRRVLARVREGYFERELLARILGAQMMLTEARYSATDITESVVLDQRAVKHIDVREISEQGKIIIGKTRN